MVGVAHSVINRHAANFGAKVCIRQVQRSDPAVTRHSNIFNGMATIHALGRTVDALLLLVLLMLLIGLADAAAGCRLHDTAGHSPLPHLHVALRHLCSPALTDKWLSRHSTQTVQCRHNTND